MAKREGEANRAFTLIEILVVVAIIAVLAGLLVTAAGRSRRRARQATCASNLQQRTRAFSLYATDYGGQLVPAPPGKLGSEELEVHLRSAYSPYVSNPGIWFCPEQPRAATPADGLLWSGGIGNTFYRTYIYYFLPCLEPSHPQYSTGPGLSDIVAADTLLIPPNGELPEEKLPDGSMLQLRPRPHGSPRHSLGNVAFCDGHVQAMTEQETVDHMTRTAGASP